MKSVRNEMGPKSEKAETIKATYGPAYLSWWVQQLCVNRSKCRQGPCLRTLGRPAFRKVSASGRVQFRCRKMQLFSEVSPDGPSDRTIAKPQSLPDNQPVAYADSLGVPGSHSLTSTSRTLYHVAERSCKHCLIAKGGYYEKIRSFLRPDDGVCCFADCFPFGEVRSEEHRVLCCSSRRES